ncbi:hypothetical protein VCRA2122O339_180104 [Vibrio crassostreae]|nr:hypothetical protein VCRA2111O320_10661 [Vibrio crassostreae]CAK2765751.1 hypothetical protein VCRA2120E331_190007 [Vibrio crassostreae]CAK2885671.1 hypothetical protein VCRA2121O336_20393 [Vibrio crassostreae]CAK3276858.1 hypothetical protein VCRA2127O345_190103 [Vibrio crassostreae]CAK3299919.1 hypothetical protein VCRA2122O339_180104 [Vibrio crassostreae]
MGGHLINKTSLTLLTKKPSKHLKYIATAYEIKHLYNFFDTIDILYNLVA